MAILIDDPSGTVETLVRNKGYLAAVALVAGAAIFAVPGGAARAVTLPVLPITNLTQVLADDTHGHVFLDTGTSVVVTNLAGAAVGTLEAAATPIAMTTEGGNVYVLDTAPARVAEYSEANLAAAPKLYPLPAGDAPASIAFQNGDIWVSYSAAMLTGAIGYFAEGATAFHGAALGANAAWPTAPKLAADPNPATEGTLIAVDGEANPTMIAAYNVAPWSPNHLQPKAEQDAFALCDGTVQDMAVRASGGQVVLACSGNGSGLGLNSATLAADPTANYPTGGALNAIAISDDNTGVAVGAGNVTVFRTGGTKPFYTQPQPGAGETVAPAGLAWSADAIWLYAVLTDGANYYLDTLQFPQYKPSTMTVNPAPSDTFSAAGKVKLAGKLTLDGITVPAGLTIKVSRLNYATKAVLGTFAAKTVAGGGFTAYDTPPAGNYLYLASYSSNTYAPAVHQCLVHVLMAKPSLTLKTSAASVKPGTTVTVTATLAAPHANRTLVIYAQPAGGAKKVIKHATVNSKGALAVAYKVTKNTTFTVTFSGDGWYTKGSASAVVKS
jgi:hypothetical protein